MKRRQNKPQPLFRQEFSEWMENQSNRWLPNVQDNYLTRLTNAMYKNLLNGCLCADPYDPYLEMKVLLESENDIEGVKQVLRNVSDILSNEIRDTDPKSKHYKNVADWQSAWEAYSEFIYQEVISPRLQEKGTKVRRQNTIDDLSPKQPELIPQDDITLMSAKASDQNNNTLPKGTWLTPSGEVHNHGRSSDFIEDFIEDEHMQLFLREFDDAKLYADWLTSKELVDAVDLSGEYARATMSRASVYNPEHALEDAVNTLFDGSEYLFEGSDIIYFVIFIGKNFGSKVSLFKSAKSFLRRAVNVRFPDEDIKIKVGIADNYEMMGSCDLGLYAFCC